MTFDLTFQLFQCHFHTCLAFLLGILAIYPDSPLISLFISFISLL